MIIQAAGDVAGETVRQVDADGNREQREINSVTAALAVQQGGDVNPLPIDDGGLVAQDRSVGEAEGVIAQTGAHHNLRLVVRVEDEDVVAFIAADEGISLVGGVFDGQRVAAGAQVDVEHFDVAVGDAALIRETVDDHVAAHAQTGQAGVGQGAAVVRGALVVVDVDGVGLVVFAFEQGRAGKEDGQQLAVLRCDFPFAVFQRQDVLARRAAFFKGGNAPQLGDAAKFIQDADEQDTGGQVLFGVQVFQQSHVDGRIGEYQRVA